MYFIGSISCLSLTKERGAAADVWPVTTSVVGNHLSLYHLATAACHHPFMVKVHHIFRCLFMFSLKWRKSHWNFKTNIVPCWPMKEVIDITWTVFKWGCEVGIVLDISAILPGKMNVGTRNYSQLEMDLEYFLSSRGYRSNEGWRDRKFPLEAPSPSNYHYF